MPESFTEWRAAGDRIFDLPAERSPQLAVDELVEDGVLQLQDQAGTAAVLRARVVDRGAGGHVEDPALALGRGFHLCRVEHLLEHARHRQQEGRLECREVGQQVLDVRAVTEHRPRFDAADLDQTAEDVGQRQEQQCGAVRVEQVRHASDHVVGLEAQVPVGQHTALGPTGRSGGVDDRGDVVRSDRRAT